jgi:hypothetical protein
MIRTAGLIAVLALASAASARAAPVPPVNVPAMVEAAELIVVGRVASLAVEQGPQGPRERFFIVVDRVLKGARPGTLAVQLDRSDRQYRGVLPREYGMFFLRRGAAGYAAAEPYHPMLVASPVADPNASASAAPLTAATHELVRVLTTPASVLTDPTTGVQRFSADGSAAQSQLLYRAAADAVRSIPYAVAGPELREAAASSDVMARLWAINCLFLMGSSDELAELKVDYLNSLRAVLLRPPPELALPVAILASTMAGEIKSPKAVRTLVALLNSTEVEVRRTAASLLGDIANDSVIAPLARTALQDEDGDVRYFAVIGLAMATKSGPAPTKADYTANEDEYLTFWRTWARTNVR